MQIDVRDSNQDVEHFSRLCFEHLFYMHRNKPYIHIAPDTSIYTYARYAMHDDLCFMKHARFFFTKFNLVVKMNLFGLVVLKKTIK